MDELTLTRAATRRKWGKPRPSIPSRFLFEMRAVADVDSECDEDEDGDRTMLEAHSQ
jgi:DNA helicase-2/ATP-dependent DNA helicase PcrA